uniref:WD repeat domain 53 n=1 Tax=Lates calcarifer TaxID=8187 RepID=A0A4W6CRU7_LATCA
MARQWSEGHSSSILCVGASVGPEGLLASGSEGGEVTVWSQEGTILGRLTLPGEEDSTSVVFSPAVPGQLYVSHGDTVSLPGGKVCRTLRRHTNICSSVAFRPHRPNNLVSAGLDMQVMLWGLQKTRPLWTLNLQDVAEEEDDHQQRPGQLFNPPLAHCVSVASCGNVLACAAEDGRVHVMRIGSGSKLEQQGAVKAHSQGASQAHFVSFLSHPYWLVTGGNDGQVALWDLGTHPCMLTAAKLPRIQLAGSSLLLTMEMCGISQLSVRIIHQTKNAPFSPQFVQHFIKYTFNNHYLQ